MRLLNFTLILLIVAICWTPNLANTNNTFSTLDKINCGVSVSSTNGIVTISGLTSAENVKLFDSNISSVWECNPWNGTPCSANEVVNNLPTGSYFLSVQSDNCSEWIPVTVESTGGGCTDLDNDGVCAADDCDDNNPNLPATIGSSCNDNNSNTNNDIILNDGCTCEGTPNATGCNVAVTSTNGIVTITGLTSAENTKIFDANISPVWECNPWNGVACSGNEAVNNLPTGSYFLSVQSDVCSEWISLTVESSGGGCTDLDNDGVCAADDCDDNNPNLPATPGSTCDDNNSNTSNDLILADGCSCEGTLDSCIDADNDGVCAADDCDDNNPNLPATQNSPCDDNNPNTTNDVILFGGCVCTGTPTAAGCNVAVNSANGVISVSGLTGGENSKLFRSSFFQGHGSLRVVWECNPWDGTPCSANEVISGIENGQYFLSVNSDVCDEWIPILLTGSSGPVCQATAEVIEDEIIINGLDDAEVSLVSADTLLIFECNDWYPECDETESIKGLSNGAYILYIESDICDEAIPLTVDYEFACNLETTVTNVVCNGNGESVTYDVMVIGTNTDDNFYHIQVEDENHLLTTHTFEYGTTNTVVDYSYFKDYVVPYDYLFFSVNKCHDVVRIDCSPPPPPAPECDTDFSINSNNLIISGLDPSITTKLLRADLSVHWECSPTTSSCADGTTLIPNLLDGQYFLSIESDLCDEYIPITIGDGTGVDSDGDLLNDDQDCAPNDATLPVAIDTPCDDGDNTTTNDVILEGECTCAGVQECNVNVIETGVGQVTITGLSTAENTKIFGANADANSIVWECNPWSTGCLNTEVVDGLIPGEQYFLAVQSDNCNEWIPIELMLGAIGDNSQFNKQLKEEAGLDKFSIINVFPNPASAEAFINIESTFDNEITLEIYDVIGQRQATNLYSIENGMNTIELDINNLKVGIYHLFVRNKIGQTQSLRFVKN